MSRAITYGVLGAMVAANSVFNNAAAKQYQEEADYYDSMLGGFGSCNGNCMIEQKTDFLTAGCYTHTLPAMDAGKRSACLNKIRSRGYTHFYVYAYNEHDYNAPSFNYYSNPAGFKQILQEIKNAGLTPVVWLVPDDAPVMANRSSSDIKSMFNNLIPQINEMVGSYVLGLELDEYWNSGMVNDLGSYLNTITDRPIAVHQTPGRYDYCGFGWCDYMIFQYGFGKSADYIANKTKEVINSLGKPVVAGEYSLNNEATSIQLGNAAISAGAVGFGNGGTP